MIKNRGLIRYYFIELQQVMRFLFFTLNSEYRVLKGLHKELINKETQQSLVGQKEHSWLIGHLSIMVIV